MSLSASEIEDDNVELWLMQVPKALHLDDLNGGEVEDGVIKAVDGRKYWMMDGIAVDEILNFFPTGDGTGKLALGKGFTRGIRLTLTEDQKAGVPEWSHRQYPEQIMFPSDSAGRRKTLPIGTVKLDSARLVGPTSGPAAGSAADPEAIEVMGNAEWPREKIEDGDGGNVGGILTDGEDAQTERREKKKKKEKKQKKEKKGKKQKKQKKEKLPGTADKSKKRKRDEATSDLVEEKPKKRKKASDGDVKPQKKGKLEDMDTSDGKKAKADYDKGEEGRSGPRRKDKASKKDKSGKKDKSKKKSKTSKKSKKERSDKAD